MRFVLKTVIMGLPYDLDELLSYSGFHAPPISNVGVRFSTLKTRIENNDVSLINWALYEDQIRMNVIYYAVFTGVKGLILVLNSSNEASVTLLEEWFTRFEDLNIPDNFPILVIDLALDSLSTLDMMEFQNQVPTAATYTNVHFSSFSDHLAFEEALNAYINQTLDYRGVIIPRNLTYWSASPPYSVNDLLELLKSFLPNIEDHIQNNHFIYKSRHGTFYVHLTSGKVEISAKCETCQRNCKNPKRRKFVCIVQRGRSWSNIKTFQHSGLLLTAAKIYAIITDTFDSSILQRIRNASECSNYLPQRHRQFQVHKAITLSNQSMLDYKTQFLRELEERYHAGKISREVYEFNRVRFGA
ncbi:MAG: hypothetical protein ACFFBD_26245 [Candidatus Hodarchaeota archaeon]